jgi:hypothetical protein
MKRKSFLSYCVIMTAVSLSILTACSHEFTPINVNGNENSDAIRFNASVGQRSEAKTRSPFQGDPSENNVLTADIFVSETAGDYSKLYNVGKTAASFNSKSGPGFPGTAPIIWPPNAATPLYFVATSPVYSATAGSGFKMNTTPAVATVSELQATSDGKTDLMYAGAETSATKYQGITAPPTITTQPTAVPLTFEHTLVLCKIYASAANTAAVDDWGKLTDAQVSKVTYDGTTYVDVPTELTLVMGTGVITTKAPSTAVNVPLYLLEDKTSLNETYTNNPFTAQKLEVSSTSETALGYVMLPVDCDPAATIPAAMKGIRLVLKSEKFDGTAADAKTADISFSDLTNPVKAGAAVKIHMTLKQNGIITFDPVTVTDWTVAGSVDAGIGG